MANRGKLFVISGPAGAGKSEIVKTLLKKHDDVKLSVSCTTRAPRPGEVNGVSYHFVTEERFQELVDQVEIALVRNVPQEPSGHQGRVGSGLICAAADGWRHCRPGGRRGGLCRWRRRRR